MSVLSNQVATRHTSKPSNRSWAGCLERSLRSLGTTDIGVGYRRLVTHLQSAVLDLTQAPRTVACYVQTSSAAVISVTYPPDTDFDTHQHDDAFLCLAVAGGYEEWSGVKRSSVEAGQERVYDAGSWHAVRTGHAGLTMLHVTDPAGMDWRGAPSHLRLGILCQMSQEIDALGDAGLDDGARLHLESLALELRWSVAPEAPEPSWLRRARTRMREGYARPITLAELATDAGIHPSHLAREFRRHHGMTAGEYLRRIRVAAATRRLADTDIPLSQVALDVGFADQSHMGRYVRRYLGTTPKAVRARLRRR